jgi:two-component system, chemotaxis family, chemotaxis protein CheY
LRPNKILVVDDSKLMHKMYEVMLRQFPVVYAVDGRAALEQLERHPDIDLVLLDLNMPYMNGLEFLQTLQGQKGVKIVIVSTEGQEDDVARGLKLGAKAAIRKPFDSEELLDAIEKLG